MSRLNWASCQLGDRDERALQLSPCGGDAATDMAGTSRMNREVHVRNCGGLVVKFHRSTRPPSEEMVHISPTSVTPTLGKGAQDTWRPFRPCGGRLDKTGESP